MVLPMGSHKLGHIDGTRQIWDHIRDLQKQYHIQYSTGMRGITEQSDISDHSQRDDLVLAFSLECRGHRLID